MLNQAIIFLLEIGFGITFNIVGTISISELMLIITTPWYLKREFFIKYPAVGTISWLYAALLISQVLSELAVGNSLNNSLRGFAVTVVSYLHFIFLFQLFVKRRSLVIYALIGMLAKQFIFGSELEGDISEALEGGNAYLLKFYIAPIIGNLLLLGSMYAKKQVAILFFLFVGVLLISLGARSSGLSLLLIGVVIYTSTVLVVRKFSRANIVLAMVMTGTLLYGAYIVYVNNVLNGKITSGNTLQLKNADNPYNPINLLMVGRTEVFVGWTAFQDKFLFGHGAWAVDNTGKYQMMMYRMQNNPLQKSPEDNNLIPAHSVWVGYGMQNGILAFFIVGLILYSFLKYGILSFHRKDRYLFIVVSFIISILWNGLFSPVSSFRLTLPLNFSFLLASFILMQRRKQGLRKLAKARLSILTSRIIQ